MGTCLASSHRSPNLKLNCTQVTAQVESLTALAKGKKEDVPLMADNPILEKYLPNLNKQSKNPYCLESKSNG